MTFKEQLINNLKDGLLLLAKYGLIIIAILLAYNHINETRQMAINGQNAAAYLIQLQQKGYLPQLVNGQVPEKKN